jgi:hypothetical protein
MNSLEERKRLQRARAGERRVPKGFAKISKERHLELVRRAVEIRQKKRLAAKTVGILDPKRTPQAPKTNT